MAQLVESVLPDASNPAFLPDVIASPLISLVNFMNNLGLSTPMRRFAFTATTAALAVQMLQPAAMYEKGVPRPFAGMTDLQSAASRGLHPTWTPWWSPALVLGALTAFFI
jgi:hypothetical protein